MSKLFIPAIIINYADTVGTVTGYGTFPNGQNVILVATAHTGFKFVYWGEDGNVLSSNNTYSFSISTNRSIKAYFTTI